MDCVVHRDIKPDNIFLLPDGTIKVVDFGIAHISTGSNLTVTGQVLGTPRYMSPEQVKGEAVGPQSDIFSAGIVFYELLTGRPAFDGNTPTTIMYRIVHEQPMPLMELNPGAPREVASVIAKATAKQASERYSSASEMSAALGDDAGARVEAAPPSTPASAAPRPRFCGECGRALTPASKFCPVCGARCAGPEGAGAGTAAPGPSPRFCRKCGSSWPDGSRACPRCGFMRG